MSDIADDANEQMELLHNIELSVRRPEGPEATGFCLHCDTQLKDGRRFCDVTCRDDWEYFKRRKHGNKI